MKHLVATLFVLTSLYFLFSCKRDGDTIANKDSDQPISNGVAAKETPLKAKVKIYFENTLSMDGYIKGNTDFKDVFRELLVALENEDQIDFETEFYLINDKLIKENFGVETTKIADALSKPSITKGNGERGTSNFEDVLNTVLENQTGDVISIVMADFVYSPKGETDAPSALNQLKTYTKNAFQKAGTTNQDIETRIYQFTSKFDGTYYDINNKSISGIPQRPYYYFVIAPLNLMEIYERQISTQLKKLPSFENEISLSSQYFPNIAHQVLTATKNNGRINSRDGIEIIDYPRQGKLEFLVALDLKALPLNTDYLLDKNNYQLKSDELKIKDVGTIKGRDLHFSKEGKISINPSDLINIQGKSYTHVILFTADGMISEDLKLSLQKKIPRWVDEINSDDDRAIKADTIEQTKTFGFSHLVKGISDAYKQRTGNEEYFNIKIQVINK